MYLSKKKKKKLLIFSRASTLRKDGSRKEDRAECNDNDRQKGEKGRETGKETSVKRIYIYNIVRNQSR